MQADARAAEAPTAAPADGFVSVRLDTDGAAAQSSRQPADKMQRTVSGLGPDAVTAEDMTGQTTVSCEGGSMQHMYRLVAVMVHHGGSESGHYTIFRCVDPQGRWFSVSDADVWPVDEATVLGCEATLLCYERDVSC